VIRARWIAGRRPDPAIRLGKQALVRQPLVARIAPELAPHPLVQVLGERFGKPVRQDLQHDRVVVVVRGFEGPHSLVEPAGANCERAYVVGHVRILRRDEIREAQIRPAGRLVILLPQVMQRHQLRARDSSA
jgi:hypothetical protein